MQVVKIRPFEHVWFITLIQPLDLERLGYGEDVIRAHAQVETALKKEKTV